MGVQLGTGRVARGRRTINAEINVTPFVDVMLVLLIVFIISAPMLIPGEEVNLPQTGSPPLEAANEQPLTITLTTDGRIVLNRENEVTLDELSSRLAGIAGEGYDQLVYIRADEGLAYGDVMQVMSRVRAVGFTRVAFVTDSAGGR